MHDVGMIDPVYVVSGMVVGVLVGLTGVGGGSLMTPLLILLFGVHPATAVGTDLLYAAVTKSVGTGVHGVNRNIDWRIVRRLAAGSLPATLVTIVALHHFGATGPRAAALISGILGVALIITATTLVLKGWIVRLAIQRNPDFGLNASVGLTVVTGIVLGVLVSISSVGAGALGTTALMFLYPRLPVTKIIGSDIAHAVPLTLLAGLGHWWLGNINLLLLLSLLTGSIPGIVAGSYLTRFTPEGVLRPLLAAVLLLVAIKLLF
jgi:uncharacterized membrane protein YfcA